MNMESKSPSSQNVRKIERGQSLVEMAIGFVLLLIVLSGLVDLGRAYFVYIGLEDAAGEGALYLALNPDCPELSASCPDPNNATYRALHAGGENLNWEDAHVDYSVPFTDVGAPVSMTISYKMKLISPFVPRFTGVNPITMTVQAEQVIIRR